MDTAGAYALCGMHWMETTAKTSCLKSQRAYEHWKAHNQSTLSTEPQSDYGKEKNRRITKQKPFISGFVVCSQNIWEGRKKAFQ